ncbi:MAG: DciA family protein [Methylococcaceae bacterium]|nr:DciA family protein [Methylococcaceae bacterium]
MDRVIVRMPARPIVIDQYIQSGDAVPASVLKQVSEQCRMLKIVRRILPESLAESLLGCVRKRTELVILTGSAACASQLRFHGPVIQETLNQNTPQWIESVKIRIIHPGKPEAARRTTRNIPSTETIRILRGCSEFISDVDLQIALNRLADTLERTNPA